MADFVERATLIVDDKSTSKVRKINSELKKLFTTVNKLSGKRFTIDINVKNLQKTKTDLQSLNRQLRQLDGRTTTVNVKSKGLVATQNQLAKLRAQASKPIVQQFTVAGGAGAGAGGAVPPGGGGRGGRRGRGGGDDGGFYRRPGLGAVAAYTMVQSEIYRFWDVVRTTFQDAARQQDLVDLQLQTRATRQQRQELLRMVDESQTRGDVFSRNERIQFRLDMLGDVGGSTEEADLVADAIEKGASRLFKTGLFDSTDELNKQLLDMVKGINLASGELARRNESTGQLEMTPEATRVLNAQLAAMTITGSALSAGEIKTFLANLKTSAFTLDENALTRIFLLAADRGVKSATQTSMMIEQFAGAQPVKKNEFLKAIGLMDSSGKAVDEGMLRTDPFEYFTRHVIPALAKLGDLKLDEEGNVAAGDITTVAALLSDFLGRQTSKSQATEIVASQDALNRTLRQYGQVRELDVEGAAQQSWVIQMGIAGKRVTDLFGTLSQRLEGVLLPVIDRIGGAATALDSLLRGEGFSTEGARDVAAVGALGIGTAAVMKRIFDSAVGRTGLKGSARDLTSAAAQLKGAAAALRGGRGVGGAAGGTGGGSRGRRGIGRGASAVSTGLVTGGLLAAFTAQDAREAGGMIAGGLAGGLIGALLGPAGSAAGAYLGSELGASLATTDAAEKLATQISNRIKEITEQAPKEGSLADKFLEIRNDNLAKQQVNQLQAATERKAFMEKELAAFESGGTITSTIEELNRFRGELANINAFLGTKSPADTAKSPVATLSEDERRMASDLKMWDNLPAVESEIGKLRDSATAAFSKAVQDSFSTPFVTETEVINSRFNETFATGSQTFRDSVGPAIGEASTAAGGTLSQAILEGSRQGGAALAAAIANATANIKVNVEQPKTPNVGANQVVE